MFEDIQEIIIKETGETNKDFLFMHGGCYVYAKLIQKKYGGKLVTNSSVNHVMIQLSNGKFYDISGEYDKIPYNDKWKFMSYKEEKLAQKRFRIKYKNFIKEN